MSPVRRYGSDPEPLLDPMGRWRWGRDAGAPLVPNTELEIWSLIHMTNSGGVTLTGNMSAKDLAMMIGLYARNY